MYRLLVLEDPSSVECMQAMAYLFYLLFTDLTDALSASGQVLMYFCEAMFLTRSIEIEGPQRC